MDKKVQHGHYKKGKDNAGYIGKTNTFKNIRALINIVCYIHSVFFLRFGLILICIFARARTNVG